MLHLEKKTRTIVSTIDDRQTQTTAKPITGADVLVESLVRHGVEVIFAYPGGASMPMHQALTRYRDRIRTILPRHEQGGIFAAEGYARVTGKPGVVMATSGPGALNLVTGLADAKLDSIPLIAITGQVPTHVIGTDAFQETPMVEVCRAITKHHYLVQNARDIARIMKEAFHIASTGPARPGPGRHAQGHPEHPGAQSRLRRGDGPARLPAAPAAVAREDPRGPGRDLREPAADHLLRRRRPRLRTLTRSCASSPPRRASPWP